MRWGIIGTGRIAATLANALKQAEGAELTAVASRSRTSAVAFATAHGAANAHASYEAMLEDESVDVVYIATPHRMHAEWAVEALRSGKHVLCEKPMGLNHAEVMTATYTAAQEQRFLMEAFMYRCHPQTQRVFELVNEGAIGEVRHVEASFGYHAAFDQNSRLFDSALGGGGILDVGCYPVSLARLILGEPTKVQAHGHLGASGVDEWSSAQLCFEGGCTAQVATGIGVLLGNTATIYGSAGRIHIPEPWLPKEQWSFELHTESGHTTETGTAEPLYVHEVQAVEGAIRSGELQAGEMNHADSLGNARVLDAWRAEIGLTYEPEKQVPPPFRHPSAETSPPIQHASIDGLHKPVSRLVMGCDNQPNLKHASTMWDHYLALGGNTFDTAYIYGGGTGPMERYLGEWHQARGIREQIVIIGKGAHTPHCTPEHIGSQLTESLERLQTEYVDLYFMHRDNLDVPVSEFVDALNGEVRAGRIRAFGGSNWSLPRVKAFNEAAAASGQQGFAAISNNYSLAQMVRQIWPGTEAVDDAYAAYLQQTQIALFPWSSQARGFFTPWAGDVIARRGQEQRAVTSMQPTVAELEHTWFSPENFARRERAGQLAEERGTSMINVALAYVLNQPFPTFPLVGPRVLEEIDSCADALAIQLSADEVAWLRG